MGEDDVNKVSAVYVIDENGNECPIKEIAQTVEFVQTVENIPRTFKTLEVAFRASAEAMATFGWFRTLIPKQDRRLMHNAFNHKNPRVRKKSIKRLTAKGYGVLYKEE